MTPDERRSSFKSIALLTLVPIAGLAVFLIWNSWNDGVTPKDVVKAVASATTTAAQLHSNTATQEPMAEAPLPKVRKRANKGTGSIVLIIDDNGQQF